MKTTDIKGKPYIEVNERLKHFRSESKYDGYSLESDILSNEGGTVTIKATIRDDGDRIVATGLAYEKEGSSFINKTSYIENCETSAWGRALGNLGIGIDTSVASADEVANAVKQQVQKPKPLSAPDVKEQAVIDKVSEMLIDTAGEQGRIPVGEKIAMVYFMLKGEYPKEMAKAATIANYLAERKLNEVTEPKE